MAYSTLRAAIQAAIKQNDNEEITGNLLQSVLLSIVNTVGAGYNFAGVATPSTNPGTPDGGMFWIGGKGTYANFGSSVTIAAGYLGIFMWDGSAFTRSVLKLSGGEGVFDVTDYTGNEYANLSAAIAAIPPEAKAGGMEIRYVQNSDHNYVQFRYMSSSTAVADFTNIANWQGVDEVPTAGSENLVKSGGVANLCKSFVLKGNSSYSYINIPYVNGGYTYSILIKNKENIRNELTKLDISYKSNGSYISLLKITSGTPILDKYIVTIPEDVTNLEHLQIFTYIQVNTQIEITVLEDKYDNEPTAGSDNLVKSSGVVKMGAISEVEFMTSMLGENTDITQYGKHGRVHPNTKVFTESEIYRLIWIKCNAGDTINVTAAGYNDNIQLAFATTKDYSQLTNITAGSSLTPVLVALTAPSDGYFLVGGLIDDDQSIIVRCLNYRPETIVTDIKRGIVKEGWDILASNQTIRENIGGQVSCIFQVKKGDVLNFSGYQYGDTSMLAFSSSMPNVGDAVSVIYTGTNASTKKTIAYVAPSDGYIIITYLNYEEEQIPFQLVSRPNALYTDVLSANEKIKELDEGFEEVSEAISQADNEISEIQKSVGMVSYDFNKTLETYLQYSNNVVSIGTLSGGITYTTTPIKVKRGTIIEIVCKFSYNDMATIASCDENGNNLSLIRLSTNYTEDVSEGGVVKYRTRYTCNEDGYVILSSTNKYGYGITIWDNIFEQEVRKVNFIPDVSFESINEDAAGEKSSWTANQIIENIYEPLRIAHPEYITRRSLGKDASGTYDIWLYEFNNNIDEWFSLQNSVDVFGTNLVNAEGLESNQFRVQKSWFDTYFATKDYKNLYVESVFTVRKPTLCGTPIEETIEGTVYYKFTCSDNVKEVIKNNQHGVTLYWTDEIKTYDQHCLLISGTHGDEISGYLGLALSLQYLVEHHSANRALDYIFSHVKLSVIPCLNIWGANQVPKVRTNSQEQNLNRFNNNPLAVEQQILTNYINSIKDELSVFVDFHTSEFWSNYGFVYAIGTTNSKLFPSLTTAANYLCKHWFPSMPPFNWNIGVLNANIATNYAKEHYDVESATVEFCGLDLMAFGECEKWSAKYMTYVVENCINFMISLCSLRYNDNSKKIIYSNLSEHQTMS